MDDIGATAQAYIETAVGPQPQLTMVPPPITVAPPRIAFPTVANPTSCPTTTPSPTATPETREIVLDLGPGQNTAEVEAILQARPDKKIIVIDVDVTYLEFTVKNNPTYSDRLELVRGSFGDRNILGGRKAVEAFSVYPNNAAAQGLPNAIQFHLSSGGRVYIVSELRGRLDGLTNALSNHVDLDCPDCYVRNAGVSTRDIQMGSNGPRVGLNSPVYQGDVAYDLWGIRK